MLRFTTTYHLEYGVVADEYEDDFFHLVVLRSGTIFIGFQLGYDRKGRHRILSWCPKNGFSHHEVIQPGAGSYTVGPVLITCEAYSRDLLLEQFSGVSLTVPINVRKEICRHIKAFRGNEAKDMGYCLRKPTADHARAHLIEVHSKAPASSADSELSVRIAQHRATEPRPVHTQPV